MKWISVWVFVLSLASHASASSRVGNGILESLDYICVPGDVFFEDCREFARSRSMRLDDFPEGPSLFLESRAGGAEAPPAIALGMVRRGDRLLYAVLDGIVDAEQAWASLQSGDLPVQELERASLLRRNDYFRISPERGAGQGFVRIVMRRGSNGKLIARVEAKGAGEAYFSERVYLRFAPVP